jgi:bacterioferritin
MCTASSHGRKWRLYAACDRSLLDSHTFDISPILRESLPAENLAPAFDCELLALVEDRPVAIEEFARQMIDVEELHAGEADKMLRRSGEVTASAERLAGPP